MEDEYPDLEDMEEDELEDNVEKQKDVQEDVYGDEVPSAAEKSDLPSLFKWIIRRKDSSKVGNLDPKIELGDVDFTVRSCQHISLLANTLGHKTFADFFYGKGEIALATSMSKQGFLTELFVTKKEFRERTRKHEIRALQPKKMGLFGKK